MIGSSIIFCTQFVGCGRTSSLLKGVGLGRLFWSFGLGLGVWGLGFGVQGLGFRV